MIGLRFTTTHIIESATTGGCFLAGSVPTHPRTVRLVRLGTGSADARSAVMGGRVVTWRGVQYGWKNRGFRTRAAAERAVRLAGGTVAAR
jgi:hypothetical protein